MPEPKGGREGLIIPAKFDPKKHCGAKLRKKETVCMQLAGYGTEKMDPFKRCYLHGGLSGTMTTGAHSKAYGKRPATYRQSLRDQIEDLKNDPELLQLTEHIATLKAMIRRKRAIAEDTMDRYDEYMDAVALAAANTGTLPDTPAILFPVLPVEEIELLGKLVKQEYEMRYGKRHSIPVIELQSILVQIVSNFNKVATKYNIPEGAKREFAQLIAGTRTSSPLENPELVRQGVPRGALAPSNMPSFEDAIEDAMTEDYIDAAS